MIKQLEPLVKKEKRQKLFDFLKTLDPAQKKELVPGIKKLYKELGEYKPDILGNYKRVGSATQNELAQVASFVCMNQADYEKTFSPAWVLEPGKLEDILVWYKPTWFNNFVNKTATTDFIPFQLSYEWMMKLNKEGYLEPSPELLAKQLVMAIFKKEGKVDVFYPEALEKYPETLNEHIWYLFDVETNLHYSNRWLRFPEGVSKERADWITCFNSLCHAGKLDRTRVLREALLASNKNFNKILSGFFSDLVTSLDPGADEIISLQKDIFSTLGAPQSKPVNTSLQLVKKIIGQEAFDAEAFLDYVPALMSCATKSVLVSTLMILEKLGKKRTGLQPVICEQVLPVFIVADNDVQTRAAKLIMGFVGSGDDSFPGKIMPYESTIMSGAKNLLMPLMGKMEKGHTDHSAARATAGEISTGLTAIPYPQGFDDFIFFASQAFDNNQSWDVDLLLHEMLQRWPSLQNQHIDKLEPALQRALKMTRAEFRTGQGNLDHMLAIFFIDVCILLVRKYPQDSGQLQQLFKQFDQKDVNVTRRWLHSSPGTFYMSGWSAPGDDAFYQPYKLLLIAVLEKLNSNELAPLLSTPTHAPAWIAPGILVEKLALYQQQQLTPHDMDFQMAVSRCWLKHTGAAIELARTALKGEYLHLFLFLLGAHDEPQGPFSTEAAWLCASLAKSPKRQYEAFSHFQAYQKPFAVFTGQFPWKVFVETYQADKYDWTGGTYRAYKETAQRKLLKIDIDREGKPAIVKGLKKLVSSFLPKAKPREYKIIYEFLFFRSSYFSGDGDIRRIILLSPNNPGPMIAGVISKCLEYPQFYTEFDKRTVAAVLQVLYDIWDNPGEMAHLLVATCLLSADKTIINLAGEIWISGVSPNGVNRHSINSALIGQMVGKQEAIEFAPLKRFTDHVMSVLFRVSAQHNQQLQLLVESLLAELPGTPIKNLKKLLEIYLELLSLNQSSAGVTILPRLAAWKQTAGLQKVLERIEEERGEG